jgi:hypothetical protein
MSLPALDAAILAAITAAAPTLLIDSSEPDTVNAPALYLLLDRFTRVTNAQYTTVQYTHTGRLAVPLGASRRAAEATLKALINPICGALEGSQPLRDLSNGGAVSITSGRTAYWTVSGVKCRICDIMIDTAEKGPRGTL